MPYAIDLFCGAGGMSEGILQAGFQILFSSDINETVQKTYMNRHEQLGLKQGINTYYHRGDIKDLTGDFILEKIKSLKIFENKEIPRIDAIFGGPPCQGFSRAGLRNPDDPRNMLFKEYVRVINELKPNYVILENVTGFTDTKLYGFKGVTEKEYPDGMCVPDILKQELDLIEYTMLEPKILNAADYGVPQRSNRIIAIAHKKGMKPPSYPKPTHSKNDRVSLGEAIGDLIRDENLKAEFKTVADKFQLIDDKVQKSVVVWYSDNKVNSQELIAQLKAIGLRRELMRKLQRCMVNIPKKYWERLQKEGYITEIKGPDGIGLDIWQQGTS